MKNIQLKGLTFLVVAMISISSCRTQRVIVKDPPPPPVVIKTNPPRAGYIWVEPGYLRQRGKLVYQPGYWVAPSPGRTNYTQGYWVKTRRGNVWVKGHF